MNKEWNLKEYLKEKEYDVLLGEYDVEPTSMYKKENIKQSIETTRQKLIENIEKYFDELSKEYGEDFSYISIEVIKIVNRCFGVEG